MNKNEIRTRFFAAYLGAKCTYPDINGKKITATLTKVGVDEIETTYKRKRYGCSGDILSWESNGSHNADALHTRLILTDLSRITDEHSIEVTKIIHENPEWHTVEQGKAWIKDFTDRQLSMIYTGHWTHIADLLRMWGYCLPFMGFDPIAEGWAILEPVKTEQ